MAEKGLRKWIVTYTVVAGVLLELIDSTVVNVALPNIMGNLGATLQDVGWVVTGYTLANVIILPISGWLGDRLGRKTYFLASILVFTGVSVLCGNSTSLTELICFRLIQGLAGGGLLSTGQAILLETWPREELGMGMAIFGVGVILGPAIGPTLGGYIVDHLSWQWIFYINLPVGLLAAFLVSTFIRESEKHGAGQPVDWWGILLLAITVGSIQIVLEKGESESWFQTTYILVFAISAVFGLLIFLWRELSTAYPIINFSIFRHKSFTLGSITTLMFGLIMFGSLFAFPLFCQNILGLTAQQTGELLIPSSVVSMLFMPLSAALAKWGIPSQFLGVAGILLFFWCFQSMSGATITTGAAFFFWPMVLLGMGRALLFVPITTLAVQDLEGKEVGQGTGLNNMMRQMGGSFGVALFTTILDLLSSRYRNILIVHVNPYNPAFQAEQGMLLHGFMARGFSTLQAKTLSLAMINHSVFSQAQLLTYNNIYRITSVAILACIPILLMQKFNKKPASPLALH
jgi:DHA2 family multidrug resistance protein